jgi:transcription antitermination factor NusA-like protein
LLSKICTVDLKSGILCSKCEEKVKSGEISESDLKVAKILLGMEAKYPALQDTYFHGSMEAGNTLIVLVKKEDVNRLLSYGGRFLKELSERTGKKRVRILPYNEEPRRFLEELFAPATVLAINTLWLPDGSIETKVVIPKRDARKLPTNVELLKELAKKIMNISLRVEVEGQVLTWPS